jgi:hypothetical protein
MVIWFYTAKNVCVLGVNACCIVYLTTIHLMQPDPNGFSYIAVGQAQDTCSVISGTRLCDFFLFQNFKERLCG